MKCVIAAGGLGTRLQNFRDNKSTKILFEVNGTPMINHQIKQLNSWGFENFVIITNPEYSELIQDVVKKAYSEFYLEFSVQDEPKGLGHAVWCAQRFIEKNENFVVILPDDIILSKKHVILFVFQQFR